AGRSTSATRRTSTPVSRESATSARMARRPAPRAASEPCSWWLRQSRCCSRRTESSMVLYPDPIGLRLIKTAAHARLPDDPGFASGDDFLVASDGRRQLLERHEEQRPRFGPHSRYFLDTCNDLHREERMAADLEEAVVETHLIDLEELLPDACDCLRGRILRRPHVMSLCHGNDGFRQCLAVHLAVRRERQRLQRHDHRWDHVRRQHLAHHAAELGW